MYLFDYLGAALILVAAIAPVTAGQNMNRTCEFRLSENTYRKMESENRSLYILNHDYLLEARFDQDCSLIQINVSPKVKPNGGVGQSGDEFGPLLTSSEYRGLIADLDKAYPMGEVIESDTIALSSTKGTISWSRREHALSEITARSTKDGNAIVSFTVYYAHDVRGLLVEKILFDQAGFTKKAKLSVDGKLYWTDELTYSASQLNRRGVFKVFGEPICD